MGAVNNPITFPRSPGDRERTPRVLGAKGLRHNGLPRFLHGVLIEEELFK